LIEDRVIVVAPICLAHAEIKEGNDEELLF
jgi:hypothetical protein